jgi:hypothetical protein
VHLRLGQHIQSGPSHDGQVDVIPLQSVQVVELVAPMSLYLVEVGPIDAPALLVASVEELEAPGHPPDLALGLAVDLGENFQCDVSLPGDLFLAKLSSGDLVPWFRRLFWRMLSQQGRMVPETAWSGILLLNWRLVLFLMSALSSRGNTDRVSPRGQTDGKLSRLFSKSIPGDG